MVICRGRFGRGDSGSYIWNMNNPALGIPFGKAWLLALEARFGEVMRILEMQSEGKPRIYVFYFNDLPEKGFLTAVTCGLSDSRRPEWKGGKPELIVTMQSQDPSWGLAAGYFASAFFDERRFSYGDVFKVDDPISDEGAMNGYLLFAPAFLDRENSRFELEDRVIHLVGLYPIHDEEIAIYDRIGLDAFWHAEGFELHNPARGVVRVKS